KLDANGLPVGTDRMTLVLDGKPSLMMRKGNQQTSTVWVPIHDGPQIELRDGGNGSMTMYDGEGRSYVFSADGPVAGSPLDGGNLLLLRTVSAPGGDNLHLDYDITQPALPGGGTGLAINLTAVRYNLSPSHDQCYKTQAILTYGAVAGTSPVSMSMLTQ